MEFVGIVSRDTPETLAKCVEENGVKWSNYFDTNKLDNKSTAFTYGVTGYPQKVLIDPEGKIIFVYHGSSEEFFTKIEDYLLMR